MESQALVVHQRSGSHGVPNFCGRKRFRTLSSVHSVGKQQGQLRVEKKLTLRPPRTSSGIGVRAKISGFQFPGTQKVTKGEESGKEDDSAAGTGTKQFKKLPGTLKVSGRDPPKDEKVVFVAGATGKVGRRVVRELVQQGYSVRAGVRNVDKAQFLVNFAAGIEESPAAEDEDEEKPKKEPEKKPPSLWASFIPGNLFGSANKKTKSGVELVEFDLVGDSDVEAALGNASVVVCAIGASEKDVLNVSAPYQVDYKATEKLIEAATQAKVKHFVLVTSLGTTKAGWPAVILNLFWGVLIWKAKAEKALMESGIPFTIVRPGGMERPTDAYKETHNVLLDKADSRFGGQVSNLQVAELIGGIVSNLGLAQNKVIEIVAETTAPLRTFEDLLAEIPSISDINKDKEASNGLEAEKKTEEETIKSAKLEEQKAAKQRDEEEKLAKREEVRAAKQRAEEEKQARLKDQRAEKLRLEEERLAKQEQVAAEKAAEKEKVEALRQKLQDQYMDAKEREEEAQREADEAVSNKADIEKKVAELRAKVEAAAQAARESKALEVAVIAAARERKTLSEQEKREVVASVRQEIAREVKKKEAQEQAEQQEKAAQALKAKAEAEQKKKAEEARAKAEAERAAKAEADKQAKAEAAKQAKAKAEAEEKAKGEAELKKKAEAEEKAKVEAAMKVKKEAEEKVKIEAEKKAKKEAEEKAKGEAEKKAKKEAEEKAKVEAELKAKKEAEVKAKEAEMKATKEREEKAKVEAEMKAKEAAEKAKAAAEKSKAETETKAKEVADEKRKVEAEIKAKAEAATKAIQEKGVEIKAKSSGFRWPWQKDVEEEKPTQTKSTEFPPSPTPLSPYTQYDGLKPPTSPTPPKSAEALKVQEEPTSPTPSKPAEGVKVQEKVPSPSSNGYVDLTSTTSNPGPSQENTKAVAAQFAAEVAAREQDALEKAKEATKATFLWPWQKEADPEPSTPTEPLSSTDLPRTSTPLSPYSRYPDMKPPTSPTPSAPKVDSTAEQQPEQVLESASTGFRWPWQ